jgi:hypothetical protein
MIIKLGKFETQFHGGLLALGLIVADNIYVNHCRKKIALANAKDDQEDQQEKEEEEA